MAEKILNTRIQLKYDLYENWQKSSLVQKKGEVAVAVIPAETGAVQGEPAVLIKVGDGEKTFSQLSFISAYAADVYGWAKAANKPSYEAKEITGIDAYIADYVNEQMGISVDTDTQYQIVKVDDYNYKLQSKGKTDEAWADVEGSAIVIPNDTAAIEALQGLVGNETVAKQIGDAITALDLANTYAAKVHTHEIAEVNGLSDAIADAKKAGTDASDQIATILHGSDAKDFVTLEQHIETVRSEADMAAWDLQQEDLAIRAAMGEVPEGKNLVQMITDAQTAATYDDTQVKADIKTNADAIAAINNADTGILAQAKEYADGKDEAIAAAKKAGDDAMAEAQKKVASVTAADASVTVGGTSTAPTVAAKLSADADNALTLAEDGLKVVIPAAAEYSIVKAAESGDYAAVYNLTKDGTIVGASINIPKDMVVESGSVVELAEGDVEGVAAGTYIKLVLANATEDELYIPVGSLIEYVTSGSATGDMVVINVSDDHKVTATITDGTITLAKLTTEVQTAIGKAHSHENAEVLAGITADQVEAWDAAEQNAKDYADGLNTAMNTRVEALEAIDHEHANKAELDKIVEGDKAKWDAAEQNAKDYADGLNTAMNTRVEALEAVDHEHANKELLDTYTQTEADLADAVAKKHAHENAEVLNGITAEKVAAWDAAEQNAKDYTDELEGELATIAKTGNVNDLIQTEGDVLVFDCGSSAV